MEANFWHERWDKNLIGFHLNEVNPYLIEYWPRLKQKSGARIFVPLCGKSLDLIWLAEQGFQVVGIELSPLAIEAFFSENKLSVEHRQIGGIDYWQSDEISIFCGDFFSLSKEILGPVAAVYDRAALIALPPSIREEYAIKLTELAQAAPKLLVTLEYEQSKMDGPPFSVTEKEVRALYQGIYQVNLLSAQDVLAENERFREKGLEFMNECIYQLEPLA